jgi:hypothetical protein
MFQRVPKLWDKNVNNNLLHENQKFFIPLEFYKNINIKNDVTFVI